ncbi:Uncharacterized protein SCF082_LOCUS37558 [Durusdinium trenchii]|uniref:Uncharacterized protein n=1 Tax=Durusdinium trenchii TaxID=1381693 RepID=A0ABP0PC07_9DINO
MKIELYFSAAVVACFDNDNDALIPELWSQMGLEILEENMVAANLVHRDFEDEIRNFGDVVNTRRPGEAKIRRRKDGIPVAQQDAVATNVKVPLDQWFYSSFVIKDGEQSYSFQDLIELHLLPHAQNIARAVDRAVLGQIHRFMNVNRVGRLGNLDQNNAKDFVLEARKVLNDNKAKPEGRSLILSSASETAMLQNDLFLKANERGDGGTALENALLGRILGFNTYMAQNVNSISGGDVTVGSVTNAAAAGASGSQAVTISGIVTVGSYATVEGNDQPVVIDAQTDDTTDTTAVTLSEANKYATQAGAVLTVYNPCASNDDYVTGHIEGITLKSHASGFPPQVGQLISFGVDDARHTYTIIETDSVSATSTTVWLDRALEADVDEDDVAFPGPAGSMNWALRRDAIALVTRPLALPQAGNVNAGNAMYNGVSMRTLMQYDLKEGGTLVNLDILAGTALLDINQAVVLLG